MHAAPPTKCSMRMVPVRNGDALLLVAAAARAAVAKEAEAAAALGSRSHQAAKGSHVGFNTPPGKGRNSLGRRGSLERKGIKGSVSTSMKPSFDMGAK
jgi:hypothetical protein